MISRTGPAGSSIRSRSMATARRPISAAGCAATVRKGKVTMASGRSSKPTTATSSGTARASSRRACSTPMAMKLLAANSAVGRGSVAITSSVMARPLSMLNDPSSRRGSGRPASSTTARRKPAARSRAVGTEAGPESMAMCRWPSPTRSRPSSSEPASASARTTSTSGCSGRRSRHTRLTPCSAHSLIAPWPEPLGMTSRPSTCRCSSTRMSRSSSSSSSSLLARIMLTLASRAAVSTPWASAVKNGFVMSGNSSAMVSVRLERRLRASVLGM